MTAHFVCHPHDWNEIHERREECGSCGAFRIRFAVADEWQVIEPRTVRAARAAQDSVQDAFDEGGAS